MNYYCKCGIYILLKGLVCRGPNCINVNCMNVFYLCIYAAVMRALAPLYFSFTWCCVYSSHHHLQTITKCQENQQENQRPRCCPCGLTT